MADNTQTCTWVGASGTKYDYWVFDLPSMLRNDEDGNYIFCCLEDGKWRPLYIGQGNLGNRTKNPDHPQCLANRGASHVHAHKNASEKARLAEEDDLLTAYSQAYAPTGCNQRKGG